VSANGSGARHEARAARVRIPIDSAGRRKSAIAGAAGLDLRQLMIITDEDEIRTVASGSLGQGGERIDMLRPVQALRGPR